MPLESLTSDQAFNFARVNNLARYPRPDHASERLFPYPMPECKPTFKIGSGEKIFTMGSCFAREVDRALSGVGFIVTSRSVELDKTIARSGKDESLYNKYTIHSILNEVRWALDPHQPYPGQAALLQVGDNTWEDPQLGGKNLSGSLSDMLNFRKSYCASMRLIADADVIVITLGLVEAWYDKMQGLYLNGAPPLRMAKGNPNRFELHTLEYDDIVKALEEIHILLVKFGNPGARFLVTVSPVPLLSTFRNQDVLVANAYSKAVQRAAIEKFVLSHSNVNYFPSYEFVALGDPNNNWIRDYRHVSPTIVNRIMSSVMLNYTPNDEIKAAAISSQISASYSAHDYQRVIQLTTDFDLKKLELVALYRVGLAYKKLGRDDFACDVFELCIEKDAKYCPPFENAIKLAAKSNELEKLLSLLAAHEINFPDRKNFREAFAIYKFR